MKKLYVSILALALIAAAGGAKADHARPGVFGDIGTPPAAEDPSHGNTTMALMVDRCGALLKSIRTDKEGHINDYRHDYKSGFCLGWINASMVFMNFRDAQGAHQFGVCLPDGIHSKDVIDTFLAFAKQHQDDAVYNPAFLIYWSLLDKYPCKP